MEPVSNMTPAEQAAAALAGLREQQNEAAMHALAGEVRCIRRGDWHDRNADCSYCRFAVWTRADNDLLASARTRRRL